MAAAENLKCELLELEKAYMFLQKIKKGDGTTAKLLCEIENKQVKDYHTKRFYGLNDVRFLRDGLFKENNILRKFENTFKNIKTHR